MKVTSKNFNNAAKKAIENQALQKALGNLKTGFRSKRESAIADLPEFEQLTQQAAAVKDHVIENLDVYLECFEEKVISTGGHVHWAGDSAEACNAVLDICRRVNAKTVTKGKSMVCEEINLNSFLENNGIQPIETDLGEYILQLRKIIRVTLSRPPFT
jgi:L-lactate dehydrogenase complex protein LldF